MDPASGLPAIALGCKERRPLLQTSSPLKPKDQPKTYIGISIAAPGRVFVGRCPPAFVERRNFHKLYLIH